MSLWWLELLMDLVSFGFGLIRAAVSGFPEAGAGCGAIPATRQPRSLPVACAPTSGEPLTRTRSLGDTPEQLVEAHSRPAGRDSSAVAEDQAVSTQFAHSALNGVLFAVPQLALDSERQLQNRHLRRVQDQDLGEDRALHDLVLLGGREIAPPDMVVSHRKVRPFGATPPAVCAARGHFLSSAVRLARFVAT
jgi:hypothetical protein